MNLGANSGRVGRFRALDGIRGLAAIGVAWGHIHGIQLENRTFAYYLFVDLFFILSGFVLYFRYFGSGGEKAFPAGRFFLTRVARLYPMHLATLLCLVLFYLAKSAYHSKWMFPDYADGSWLVFGLQLLMAHNMGIANGGLYWNQPSWSVSVEFLASCALFGLMGRMRQERIGYLACVLTGSGYLALFVQLGSLNVETKNLLPGVNAGMIRGVAGLALGVLCFRMIEGRRRSGELGLSKGMATVLEGGVLLVAGLLIFRAPTALPADFVAVAVFAAIVGLFSREQGYLSMLLGWGPFWYAGTISYSIYLMHGPLGTVLGRIGVSSIWAVLPLVILASSATYHLIESPCQRWMADRLRH